MQMVLVMPVCLSAHRR